MGAAPLGPRRLCSGTARDRAGHRQEAADDGRGDHGGGVCGGDRRQDAPCAVDLGIGGAGPRAGRRSVCRRRTAVWVLRRGAGREPWRISRQEGAGPPFDARRQGPEGDLACSAPLSRGEGKYCLRAPPPPLPPPRRGGKKEGGGWGFFGEDVLAAFLLVAA